jgi:hypothetical protein
MATTLRLGKTHYEALLPQLEEMGWTSADAHQVRILYFHYPPSIAFDSILWLFRSTPTPLHRLSRPQVLATSPQPSIGTNTQPLHIFYFNFILILLIYFRLVARPASGDGGVVEPTPYQAPPPAVVVPVPATSSLSAPSAALAPVAPAGGAEKSEYERKQRELELRKAREEKRQREEEQRRIKEHIKDMKLDRARKVRPRVCGVCGVCALLMAWRGVAQYNRGGGETTGRAPVPTSTGSAPSTPTPAASASAASSSPVALLQVPLRRHNIIHRAESARGFHFSPRTRTRPHIRGQIRLPTGATVKHEFASTDTLGNRHSTR